MLYVTPAGALFEGSVKVSWIRQFLDSAGNTFHLLNMWSFNISTNLQDIKPELKRRICSTLFCFSQKQGKCNSYCKYCLPKLEQKCVHAAHTGICVLAHLTPTLTYTHANSNSYTHTHFPLISLLQISSLTLTVGSPLSLLAVCHVVQHPFFSSGCVH